MLASLLLPFWDICARLWLPVWVMDAALPEPCWLIKAIQVAALLQDVGFLIAARLHDLSEQRLAVLLQQRDVGLAVLVDQGLLAHRWWQLAEVDAGCHVVVFHQVVGARARAAADEQARAGRRSTFSWHAPLAGGLPHQLSEPMGRGLSSRSPAPCARCLGTR